MPTEKPLLNKLMLAATAAGARLFRNNVALAWVGTATKIPHDMTVRVGPGDVVIRNARPLHAGLAKGSADLIGWVPVKIEPWHVGHTLAVFVSCEAKTPGVPIRKEQNDWAKAVRDAGGVGVIVWNVDELEKALRNTRP